MMIKEFIKGINIATHIIPDLEMQTAMAKWVSNLKSSKLGKQIKSQKINKEINK